MKRLKIYIDTSVIGGCYDPEFDKASRRFIALLEAGVFDAYLSPLTLAEIERADRPLREKPQRIIEQFEYKEIQETAETRSLTEAYLKARVTGRKFTDDARHIAIATVHNMDVVVSWNFRHLVNIQKIRAYNAVT